MRAGKMLSKSFATYCSLLVITCLLFLPSALGARPLAEQDLAVALLAAKTKEERAQLLSEGKELITSGLVRTLYQAGDKQAKQGQFAEALRINAVALEVAEVLGDKAALAWCYVYRGLVFYYQSQHPPALDNYQRALPLFQEANDRRGTVATLNSIGNVYLATGKYQEALQAYRESLKIAEEIGDRAGKARAVNNIGELQRLKGEYEDALAQFKAGLEIERELGNRAGEAGSLNNIGNVYLAWSKYREALEAYEESLKIARETGDKAGEAMTLGNIGAVYEATLRYAEALTKFEQSLKIARELGDKSTVAHALNNRGNVYLAKGEYGKALGEYEASLKVAREINRKADEATALSGIGNVYLSTGRYAEALAQFEAGLRIENELGNRAGGAQALGSVANVYQSIGKYAEALGKYEAVLKVFRELGMKAEEAATLNNIGGVYLATNRYQEALYVYEASRKLRREIDDKVGEAVSLNNIGAVYQSTGRYREALAQFDASLKIAREKGYKPGEASSLANIANVYLATGEQGKARGAYEKIAGMYQMSLMAFRLVGMKAEEAQTLSNIGVAYRAMGRHREALAQFEASLKIAREIGRKPEEAQALNNIGVVYQATGRYSDASVRFEASLKLAREMGNRAVEAQTLNNQGAILQLTGAYWKALEAYQESSGVFRKLGMKAEEARTQVNIGNVYSATGQYREALEVYKASLGVVRKLEMRVEQAQLWNNIGNVYLAMGRENYRSRCATDMTERGKYRNALAQFKYSLRVAGEIDHKPSRAVALNNLGVVYEKTCEYEKALEVYEERLKIALELDDKAGEARTLSNKGMIYAALRRQAEALAQFEAALKIAESLGAPEIKFHAHWGIGNVRRAQKQWEPAAGAYQNAIAQIELIRTAAQDPFLKIGFLAQYTAPYYGLVTCLLELNKKEEALRVAEQAKARTLVELLQRAGVTREITPESEERKRLDVSDLSQLSPDGRVVFLEYVIGEEHSYLFVITLQPRSQISDPERQVAVTVHPLNLKRGAKLTNLVVNLRKRMEAEWPLPLAESQELYQHLVAPAEKALRGRTVICIVPDGDLWDVPFAALQKPDGRYLIETHAVFYAPSLTSLKGVVERAQKRQPPPPNQLLAMAPFAYSQGQRRNRVHKLSLCDAFPPLPASAGEVNEVAALFGAKPYLRRTATEFLAKRAADSARILHFATHGVYFPPNPMSSGILLASGPDEQEDCFLEAREILYLDLNADLVVLSACETAQGKIRSGEGALGLSWALFVAGSTSNVLSQWKVADESTARLMVEFYRRLLSGARNWPSTMGKAEALRQAQLKLLRAADKKWEHPYFWAPFILMGEWR